MRFFFRLSARAGSLTCRVLMIGVCLAYAFAPGPARADAAPNGLVKVTIKFLPRATLGAPVPVMLHQDSCPPCRQMREADFARENTRETIVELLVPAERSLALRFDAPSGVFARAILETNDIPMISQGNGMMLALPPLVRDATAAGEFATHVTGTGYVLRFEHADPARRFGAYARSLPINARHAADNFEFGLRQAVMTLGLGQEAVTQQVGIIEIMGFDTNEPHEHMDAPPHIHMHLRWPYNVGTQIGHFYLTPDGRLDHIRVGVAGLHMPTRDYAAGQDFETISPKRSVFYTQTVTPEGNLHLRAANGQTCDIGLPSDDRRRGVHVRCDGHPTVFVRVEDDLARGALKVWTDDLEELFRYDTGTGMLLSPVRPPPAPLSAIAPRYTGLQTDGPEQ